SVIFESSSSLATIGSSAFQNCSSLTSITIPNTVTSIAGSAFCGCTNLDSVIFESSSSLATIGSSAFENCKDLTVITIPSEVTIISSYAFSGCIALATVTFKGTTAPTFGSGSFLNLKSGAIAYVPAGSIGTGKYDHNAYPFIINSPLTLTESAADSTGSGTSRPLTPDEWVNLNLDMGQLVNHHGATSTGFLGMLYDNSMLRIPDSSGLIYWNEKLTLQIYGANFVTEHFLFSDEIGAKVAAMSSVEYVNFLYSTLFARVPDADGYNNWLSYLNGGFSKEETLRAFLNNEEWINICTLFNVTP
ncbi:MAG: leucine-rich repeat protein, partial [Actinomycetota bacterium]